MIAPAHIAHGSSVTYSVQSVSRHDCIASDAAPIATISACAVASRSDSTWLRPRPITTPPWTMTQPIGTSSASAAACASRSAARIPCSSFRMNTDITIRSPRDGRAAIGGRGHGLDGEPRAPAGDDQGHDLAIARRAALARDRGAIQAAVPDAANAGVGVEVRTLRGLAARCRPQEPAVRVDQGPAHLDRCGGRAGLVPFRRLLLPLVDAK